MDDLISRQEAYEVLTAYYHHSTDLQHAALHDALSKVTSAERHGRWEMSVRNIHNQIIPFIACSICGKNANDKYPYCPNCGSRMNLDDEVKE